MLLLTVKTQLRPKPLRLLKGKSQLVVGVALFRSLLTVRVLLVYVFIVRALPVREFPNNLTSEPASLCQSASSSVAELANEAKPSCGKALSGPHREELRCVVAIIRHGDRTPKQKLKLNVSEPHILQFFHEQ